MAKLYTRALCLRGVGLNVNGFFREKMGYIRAGKFGERKNITIPKPD
jgi:hypothetical protein